ncbi:MAG: hypothetical protein EVB12_00655 [Winogradskyella sp.]|nr:MAG: hypothetical protein EVB12_00655 [Winogradskyella sp.]
MLYANNFSFESKDLDTIFNKTNISNYLDLKVTKFSPYNIENDNSVYFFKKISDQAKEIIEKVKQCIIILPENELSFNSNNIIIKSNNPRLDFAKLASYIYYNTSDKYDNKKYCIKDNNIIISDSASVSKNATIYPNVYIGPNTIIEQGVIIHPNVSILGNVIIKKNSQIGSNTTIGNQGFGGERDVDGKIYMIPHLGGVVIEENVRIGSNNTIVAGTINPTIVGAHSKFDDHIHFAHNCRTGKSCFVTACAQFSGSITLGDRVWIGPNVSLIQGITIEDDSTVGIGSVVTKNVKENQIVTGSPATELKEFINNRKILKKILNENN